MEEKLASPTIFDKSLSLHDKIQESLKRAGNPLKTDAIFRLKSSVSNSKYAKIHLINDARYLIIVG